MSFSPPFASPARGRSNCSSFASPRSGGYVSKSTSQSAHSIEHDHRDLALGLLLVIGVGWPEFERLFPQSRPLRAGGGPGARLHFRGPDLHVHIRAGEEVAV